MTDTTQSANFDETLTVTPGLWSFLSTAVLIRATAIALGLGSVLTLANQADAIFGGGQLQLLPLILVYATPLVVVTVSQLLGAQRATLDARQGARSDPAEEAFLSTALSHGIPVRALRIGLLVGAVSMALATTASLLEAGNLAAVSLGPSVQAFSLPILFGVLSQAVAYRRGARTVAMVEVAG